MGFNLLRFLRRLPPSGLRHYFEAREISLPDQVSWDKPESAALPKMLFEAINALEQRCHDAVVAELEQVDQLCDFRGQMALQSLVADDADLLSRLSSADSDETRGIIMLLEYGQLFDHALSVAYTDRLRNGRNWNGFSISDPTAVSSDPRSLSTLEADIATALKQPDGSGGKLKVDSFERRTIDRDGGMIGLNVHYSIYVEGSPESQFEYNGNELTRRTRRPVHEGAISYDPDRRILDVIAKGGKKVRTDIAGSFARNILGVTEGIHPVVLRRFMLDRFKQPHAFESDAADGIKAVKVILLRLELTSGGYGRVTIEIDPSDHINIHTRSEQWFGETDPLQRPDWRVTQAKLWIVFHPEEGKTRQKVMTIELRAPNGSNLREQIRHHQIVSQKCLTRWGLVIEHGA